MKKVQTVTRKIELIAIGSKEEINTTWEKLRLWNSLVFRAANTVVNTQNSISLLIDEVCDKDRDLTLKAKEARNSIKEIVEWKKEISDKIYLEYGEKKESLKGEITDKKEFKKLSKDLDNERKEKIKSISDKAKLKKKPFSMVLNSVKAEATKMVMNTLAKSIENVSYGVLADKFNSVPSNIRSALNQRVFKCYSNEKWEVENGMKSLRTYKKSMSIPFNKNSTIKFKKVEDFYQLQFFNKVKFGVRLGRDRSNNELVIQRVMNGTYKFCDSEIQLKDKKIFLLMAVQMPVIETTLDRDKIVGVDLGINVPAYVCVNKGKERRGIGSRNGFIKPRTKIAERRKDLQRDLKYTKGGRGREKKLSRLNELGKKERNTVKTLNHQISRAVIDFALKANAGVIHLEKLTGIARDEKSKWILRNWSYFELQTFIEYKANMYGIEVRYINPAYTSQSCPECQHVSRKNRKTQAQFKCTSCNFKENADWVGAYNIANSDDFVERKGAKLKPTKKTDKAA